MRWTIIFFSCVLLIQGFVNPIIEDKKENIQVIKEHLDLSYSNGFLFKSNNEYLGRVVRTGLMCPRYFYDLYDRDDNFSVRGITNVCLGLMNERKTCIDIYDNQDNFIGKFEGKGNNKDNVEFIFYDAYKKCSAIAQINTATKNIVIKSADNLAQPFVKFNELDVKFLNIEFISENCCLDNRMIKIFAAFISDFYENFMNREEIMAQRAMVFDIIMQIFLTCLPEVNEYTYNYESYPLQETGEENL